MQVKNLHSDFWYVFYMSYDLLLSFIRFFVNYLEKGICVFSLKKNIYKMMFFKKEISKLFAVILKK